MKLNSWNLKFRIYSCPKNRILPEYPGCKFKTAEIFITEMFTKNYKKYLERRFSLDQPEYFDSGGGGYRRPSS